MITDTTDFWDKVAKQPNWQDYILPGKTPQQFHDSGVQQAKLLEALADKNKTVLDYGCGIGRVLKHVAPMFKTAYGVDVCQDFLTKASEYCNGIDNIRLTKPKKVDVVYSLMVMQHNSPEKRKQIMADIYKMLKIGGIAIIQFPDANSKLYKETKFVHRFTKKEIKELAAPFRFYGIGYYNLAAYQSKYFDPNETNELLLIATK